MFIMNFIIYLTLKHPCKKNYVYFSNVDFQMSYTIYFTNLGDWIYEKIFFHWKQSSHNLLQDISTYLKTLRYYETISNCTNVLCTTLHI
jgi:hypothetical protein